MSSKSLPSSDTADNIATLLRLQGLSRISGLLCPVLRPTAASADELQEGVLPLGFLGHFVGLETPIMLWHVSCIACLPGQGMQLCSSARIHSHKLAKSIANAYQPILCCSTLSLCIQLAKCIANAYQSILCCSTVSLCMQPGGRMILPMSFLRVEIQS